MFGEVGFEPFGKFTPREHDVASATFAVETNIRAETGDSPFVGAAGVLFTQTQVIVELKVGEHGLNKSVVE